MIIAALGHFFTRTMSGLNFASVSNTFLQAIFIMRVYSPTVS